MTDAHLPTVRLPVVTLACTSHPVGTVVHEPFRDRGHKSLSA